MSSCHDLTAESRVVVSCFELKLAMFVKSAVLCAALAIAALAPGATRSAAADASKPTAADSAEPSDRSVAPLVSIRDRAEEIVEEFATRNFLAANHGGQVAGRSGTEFTHGGGLQFGGGRGRSRS